MEKGKKRMIYGIIFIMLFMVEVLIGLYIHDNIIRPYVGDVIVVLVVYCFVRIIIPEGVKRMPLYVFVFATFVEGLQYFQLVKVLGLEDNTFAKVLIGSTFDVKDIVMYGVGCVVILICQHISPAIYKECKVT